MDWLNYLLFCVAFYLRFIPFVETLKLDFPPQPGTLSLLPVLEAHASRDHPFAGPLWEGYRESGRCSRDTYPESYITKYTG